MELTVYRQASKERDDGAIVYKGEDALPFVGNNALLIADGMGGRSATYHKTVSPDMFEPDRIYDTLFTGVFEDEPNPEFLKYLRDSFFELFAVRDIYTDNILNIKKGGYFGSRIASAILIHELLYANLSVDEWIEKLSMCSRHDREKLLNDASTLFSKALKRMLMQCAENAHLVSESAMSGLSMLASTMTMTLFRETPDEVQAVYLTAGDSRAYMWSETDGLCQLIRDEAGADGGMTNYINADADNEFTLNCTYMSFKKPCILFNASDGCYGSKYFISPLGFEKLLLETFAASSSTGEISESLQKFFEEYGRHDDSSTIAMKMFGYQDLSDLIESAKRRLEIIDKDYISKLPKILETDYSAEPDEADETADQADRKLRADLQEALFKVYEHDYEKYMSKGD